MNYKGINGNGQVVIPVATKEQVAEFKANPAYKFVRFIPTVAEVPPPIEVVDAEPNQQLNNGDNNTKGRSGRKTNREKS